MEKTYKTEEVGEEYLAAIDRAIEIRKNRRPIYGDSFLQENDFNILAIIDGKRNRLGVLLKNQGIVTKDKILDEILDILNYYAFLFAIKQKEFENA